MNDLQIHNRLINEVEGLQEEIKNLQRRINKLSSKNLELKLLYDIAVLDMPTKAEKYKAIKKLVAAKELGKIDTSLVAISKQCDFPLHLVRKISLEYRKNVIGD